MKRGRLALQRHTWLGLADGEPRREKEKDRVGLPDRDPRAEGLPVTVGDGDGLGEPEGLGELEGENVGAGDEDTGPAQGEHQGCLA